MTTHVRLNKPQRTLKSPARLCGVGLHSGVECEVIICPADENTGIVFRRNGRDIPGHVGSVVDTARSTTLGAHGDKIVTVEHMMAALRGTGIDNARVEVQGSEMPALDGSAREYVEAILAAGVVEQSGAGAYFELSEPVWVVGGGGCILAVPSDRFEINYVMRYDHPMIGSQVVGFAFDEDTFVREIAPARTFVIYEEVASLLSQRLAQGGSLDNTIVVWQDHMSCDLRFPDELARHKVLDLVGDLALVGGELRAEIVAVKSGHTLNVELAKKLSASAVRKGWEG